MLEPVLRIADIIAFTGVAFLPSVLLHTHLTFWHSWEQQRFTRGRWRVTSLLSYIPVLLLPGIIYQIATDQPYSRPLEKFSDILLPYSIWLAIALWTSAALDLRFVSYFSGLRERQFFHVLAVTFTAIGVAFILTYPLGARELPVVGKYIETLVMLSSLLPITIVAYYIYRYGWLELIIKQSLVYAGSAVIIIIIYFYGIRKIDDLLVERLNLTPGVIEAILTLGLVALAPALKNVVDYIIHRLFAREMGLYRDLVKQLSTRAANFGELRSLLNYIETEVARALEPSSVRILPPAEAAALLPEDVIELVREQRLDVIDDESKLAQVGAVCAYPLWCEERLVGMMLVSAPVGALDSDKRSLLAVLCGQIAIAIENCQLIEEKVMLERELAERERLATLGRMAATVAHEVKNPLSSIKSIVQVMQEDQSLARGHGRGLSLIIGEIDRLNRTVTQLLSFSRPSRASAESVQLQELINSTVKLFESEAQSAGVEVYCRVDSDLTLNGIQGAALREILTNLLLNAIQATSSGGRVNIKAIVQRAPGRTQLEIVVTDTGVGIPERLRSKIFEPFFTTKQRGTGLGLAIVQRRLAELGGRLDLISPVEDGRGARFKLAFPISNPSLENSRQ